MTKQECRLFFLDKRRQLTDVELTNGSLQIIERLLSAFDLTDKVVSVFMPIEKKREINTTFLFELCQGKNTTFVLPLADFSQHTMRHIIYEDNQQLQVNKWGIPEPIRGKQLSIDKIDIVLVPLLCCDMQGFRVGYGGGFYDRMLVNCKKDCLFIGLSIFEPIPQISDMDTTDIPLHLAITPKKIFFFEKKRI